MKSLRVRLFVVWALSLASACAVGFLLVQLYRQSTTAQVARADAATEDACERVADRYAYYTAGWSAPAQAAQDEGFRHDLVAVIDVALAGSTGIAGGIWQTDAGALTTADLPDADKSHVQAINEAAAQAGLPESEQFADGRETVVLHACPLRGPVVGVTAWTMSRVIQSAGWDELRLGLGVLLALVLALSASLTWLVLAWTRHVGRIEAALASAGDGDLPTLAPTGEAELDRIVLALNTAGTRLAEARHRSAELSARIGAAERLAALGRVAAGVAHEFRNPIAAMRLKAENALGNAARRGPALESILTQIARLDALIAELLAMTQRREPERETVDIAALLATAAEDRGPSRVTVDAPNLTATLDPKLLRRALDALLDNALRHTPEDGRITLRARANGATLRIEIADTGPGIAPDLRATLFEPFVSGRADGTGLGLAIARELAEAQGGRLVLAEPGGDAPGKGAVFALEMPWQQS